MSDDWSPPVVDNSALIESAEELRRTVAENLGEATEDG